jgi:hypothetical protein
MKAETVPARRWGSVVRRGRENFDLDPLFSLKPRLSVHHQKHVGTVRGKSTNDDAPRLVAMIGRSTKDKKHGPVFV